MDAKQIFGLLSGTVAFVAVVALGAFAVVSLSPDERRVPVIGQPGLLIEDVKPLRSFDTPAPRAPAITDAPAQAASPPCTNPKPLGVLLHRRRHRPRAACPRLNRPSYRAKCACQTGSCRTSKARTEGATTCCPVLAGGAT